MASSLVALAVDKKDPRRQEWSTPQLLFDCLNDEYEFDFDAAASDENTKCPDYWTKEDNALTKIWSRDRNYFCNPPWNNIGPFIYVRTLYQANCAFLVPARTDRKWFADAHSFGAEVHLFNTKRKDISGDRVEYVPHPDIQASQIAFGSALLVMGRRFVRSPGGLFFRDSETGERL